MHMKPDIRDERGTILALSAVMIPVFIVLIALDLRRRDVVHAQAAAAEPRRRGRTGGRGRVRESLARLRR